MACNGLGVTAMLVAGSLAVLNPGADGKPPLDAAATAAIAAAFLTAFAAATARPRCIAAPRSAAAAANEIEKNRECAMTFSLAKRFYFGFLFVPIPLPASKQKRPYILLYTPYCDLSGTLTTFKKWSQVIWVCKYSNTF